MQAEEGYITEDRQYEFCAERLGLARGGNAGCASFYSMYKHHPWVIPVGGLHQTPVRRVGRRAILADWQTTCRIGDEQNHARRKGQPGALECKRRMRIAPVVWVHGQTGSFRQQPQAVRAETWWPALVRAREGTTHRGSAPAVHWKQASRILEGLHDGQAARGNTAGEPYTGRMKVAKEQGTGRPTTRPDAGSSGTIRIGGPQAAHAAPRPTSGKRERTRDYSAVPRSSPRLWDEPTRSPSGHIKRNAGTGLHGGPGQQPDEVVQTS